MSATSAVTNSIIIPINLSGFAVTIENGVETGCFSASCLTRVQASH